MKTNIVILNYNGENLLSECLPSIVAASKNADCDCRVTVLDNRSTDQSIDLLKKDFPEVDIYIAKKNKIYFSYNDIAKDIDDDIMVVMNNDIKLDRDYIKYLIAPFFENDDIFFVAAKGFSFDGKDYQGDKSKTGFRWGIMEPEVYFKGYENTSDILGYTFSAGVGAFDRKKFIELGGYDDIYYPGRYEDVDLSYRGWKRGWVGLYQPKSVHYHKGGASFNRDYKQKEIARDVFRNSILFTIKNITDPILLLKALGLTLLRVFYYCLTGRWYMVEGFFAAINRSQEALKAKHKQRKNFLLSDKEAIGKINRDIQARPITFKTRLIDKIKDSIVNLDKIDDPIKRRSLLALFFPIGMLFFPLEYILIRELLGCEKILDLGCGTHSMVGILPKERFHTVGVELFDPYLDKAIESKRHAEYIKADMLQVAFDDNSFDAVVLLDVVEHLKKEDGLALLEKAKKWARKKIIVNTPNGFFKQAAYDDNDLQEHLSGWEISEFKKWGFSVNGLRGFNWMHLLLGRPKISDKLKEALVRVINIFNFIVYFFPRKAHQIFCVKTMIKE